MNKILPGRWTARPEGDFVVFIIGMRINHWWMIHRWLPLIRAMSGMIRELSLRPELGFLGGKTWFGRTIVLIQYWRSFEDLENYAKAKGLSHVPAWAAFNRMIGNDGTVGIYHETYRIGAGQHENVFINMPPTLIGDCATLIEAKGNLVTAAGRMDHSTRTAMPEDIKPEVAAISDQDRYAQALNPENREAADRCEPRIAFKSEESLVRALPDSGLTPAAELHALVEQALEIADARELSLVSIDLCSALERLRAIDDAADRKEFRTRA